MRKIQVLYSEERMEISPKANIPIFKTQSVLSGVEFVRSTNKKKKDTHFGVPWQEFLKKNIAAP